MNEIAVLEVLKKIFCTNSNSLVWIIVQNSKYNYDADREGPCIKASVLTGESNVEQLAGYGSTSSEAIQSVYNKVQELIVKDMQKLNSKNTELEGLLEAFKPKERWVVSGGSHSGYPF